MNDRPRQLSRVQSAITIGLAVALGAVVAPRFHSALVANIAGHQDDFHTFYRTARCLFVERCDPYEYIPGIPPNLEPPHAHLLLLPVFLFPQFKAYVIWMTISILALVAAAMRFRQVVRVRLPTLSLVALFTAAAGSSLMMAAV